MPKAVAENSRPRRCTETPRVTQQSREVSAPRAPSTNCAPRSRPRRRQQRPAGAQPVIPAGSTTASRSVLTASFEVCPRRIFIWRVILSIFLRPPAGFAKRETVHFSDHARMDCLLTSSEPRQKSTPDLCRLDGSPGVWPSTMPARARTTRARSSVAGLGGFTRRDAMSREWHLKRDRVQEKLAQGSRDEPVQQPKIDRRARSIRISTAAIVYKPSARRSARSCRPMACAIAAGTNSGTAATICCDTTRAAKALQGVAIVDFDAILPACAS